MSDVETVMDLRALPSGIYAIRVSDLDGRSAVKKLIVQ
jgi:hypothetical protein